MERVKKGEKYWYIASDFFADDFYITYGVDFYEDIQDGRFAIGNYFHTKEEAEAMARKLRAVLQGAYVIERPSEEEKSTFFFGHDPYDAQLRRYGFEMCYDWLKSKIVK